MKAHHVAILAAMQGAGLKPRRFSVREIAETTGMTTMRVRNALKDLHYDSYLVVPAERKHPKLIVCIDYWRLSQEGVRLVHEMKRHFKGEM